MGNHNMIFKTPDTIVKSARIHKHLEKKKKTILVQDIINS